MSRFILIHTCLDSAFAAIAEDGEPIAFAHNDIPKEHGAFLHEAIKDLIKEKGLSFTGIDAVGVTNGPGSYTGIRVGLSAAKGIAYALQIPIVLCSTLEALAATGMDGLKDRYSVYIPMIHARKYEYYSAAYSPSLEPLTVDTVVDARDENIHIFDHEGDKIVMGVGLADLHESVGSQQIIPTEEIDVQVFTKLIFRRFQEGRMTDAASSRPVYLKEAYTTTRKKGN